jgi:lysophospholipase L1-like esterase
VARTALLAAVAVAALAGVAAGRWLAAEPSGTRPVTGAADSSRYESSGPPEGRLDEPWAVDAGQESVEAFSGRSYDPFLGYVLADYAGDYVNVTDGQRRSYQAADAGEDPYEVWFLGGSALFGFASQRDEHTVPSEVARLAEAAGTPVVVRNFGVPGYTNYQEVQVLADALLDGGRPDLVVFTDGYNDLSYQLGATYLGIAGAGRPAHIFSDLGAAAFAGAWGAPPELGLGAPEATPSLEEASSQTAAVYERGMELAERLGETYGFETLFTWQPSLHSLAPDADLMVSEGFDAQAEATFRAANRQVLDQLGPGVIDLSPALDQLEQPTLVNAVHFNEAGAAALGAALWEQIEPARGQP